MTGVIVKTPDPKPIAKMVVPGRRALGEGWREVTIRPDPITGGVTVENEEAPAPPQGRPVVIPAMANLSDAEVNFILGGALKAQDYYTRQQRRPTDAEVAKEVNALWQAYCEQKLRLYKGQSTFGPGGHTQREKVQR